MLQNAWPLFTHKSYLHLDLHYLGYIVTPRTVTITFLKFTYTAYQNALHFNTLPVIQVHRNEKELNWVTKTEVVF